MSIIIFVQVFLVCLLGAMSPGPSMVVVINNAISKNRYHGILTSIGHGIGIGIYALFAVLGIGLIIKTNGFVFNGIKILSIFFLFYLGVKSFTSQNKIKFGNESKTAGLKSFVEGFSISILNPKIFIWFVAIYSQFMSIENDLIFNSYLIITASIVDASWYILLTFIATSGPALRFFERKSNKISKIIGSIFMIISLILIFDIIK